MLNPLALCSYPFLQCVPSCRSGPADAHIITQKTRLIYEGTKYVHISVFS